MNGSHVLVGKEPSVKALKFVTAAFSIVACGLLSAADTGITWPESRLPYGLLWTGDGKGILVFYGLEKGAFLERRDFPGWELRWKIEASETPFGKIRSLFLSPDGERVLVLGRDTVEIVSVSDGGRLASIDLHGKPKRDILAACTRAAGSIAVLVREWTGIPTALYLEEWSPAGELLSRTALDTGDLDPPKPAAAFSPDGKLLLYAAGTEDLPAAVYWSLRLRNLVTGEEHAFELWKFLPEPGWDKGRLSISSVALRPDGREIAVGLITSDAGKPILLRIDAEAGRLKEASLYASANHTRVEYLAYSPDGGRLATSSANQFIQGGPGRLTVLRLGPTGSVAEDLCVSPDPTECPRAFPAFSPDGHTLASLWWGGMKLWDLCPEGLSLPAPGWSFSFSSGGAHHPQGYGEWRVRLDPSGNLAVEHQVMDEVETFGPFVLRPEENEALWGLIQSAEIPCLSSSTRAGIPDEPLLVFSLEGPNQGYRVELWRGDVEDNPRLKAILDFFSALIRTYTGKEPRL